MDIKITAIATANPGYKLAQLESLRQLKNAKKLSRTEKVLYERFLSDKGIDSRYFAIDNFSDFFEDDPDNLVSRFQEKAAELSALSVDRAILAAGVGREEISSLAISTCTGYICPGLTSYAIEKSQLPSGTHALDIVGMGCGGAIPALRESHNYLKAHKDSFAIAGSTEVCSAAISWDDDPELILSNSIFGDGSAACVLTNNPGGRGLKINGFESKIMPEHRDELRFRTKNARLRNVIKVTVPAIAASLVKGLIQKTLKDHGLKKDDVKFWAVHPGGRRILDAIAKASSLTEEDLEYSRRILFNYGNMSSPSVLYVLKEIMESKIIEKGDRVMAISFGAGFSGYACLLTCEC